MDNLVSCQGSDCNICTLFETISHLYNYLLGISFAAAILILVIAGFFYLMSVGDSERRQRSLYFIKTSLIGFVFILLGWLAIRTTASLLGFKNAGNWWQFQCNLADYNENSTQVAKEAGTENTNVVPDQNDNLTTFKNLEEFLKSKALKGRILGPDQPSDFVEQVKNLPEGKALKFLAPVRLKYGKTDQNVDLPLLTIEKVGGNIQLKNTGEYLNIIQRELAGKENTTGSDLTAISQKGDIIPTNSLKRFEPLFAEVSGVLSTRGAENLLGITVPTEDTSTDNVSAFIAEGVALLQEKDNYSRISDYLARLVTMVMQLLSSMIVEVDNGNGTTDSTTDTSLSTNQNTNTSYNQKDPTDSDGDGIPDWQDACPYTQKEFLGDVNKDKTAEGLYGCSCNDMQVYLGMGCPLDGCLGQYWVTYPTGIRNCKNARMLPYSCTPTTSVFNPECPGLTDKSTTVETDTHDDRGINYGTGNDGTEEGNSPDSSESVKQALRLIHEYDPLRYEMIFRYVDRIIGLRDPNMITPDSTTDGFTFDGSGAIWINYTQPVTYMAETIVHESTHAAHMYLDSNSTNDVNELERIANANQMGSLCRASGYQDMSEFPGQSGNKVVYGGKEVRGLFSRMTQKANPLYGYLGSAAYYQTIWYASSFGNLVQGPYHYGDDQEGYVLGLTENEDNVIRKILTNKEECLSKPTDDLPPVPACDNVDRTIKIGGYDWYPN